MSTALACVSLIFITAGGLTAQSVTVLNGNVEFLDRQGLTHQISHSGMDSEPSLSRDGSKIVFIRTIQESPTEMSQLWICDTRPATTRQVYARDIKLPDGRTSGVFFSPAFSADGQSIYFLAASAATSHALCRLDLNNGHATFLSPAMDYRLIQAAPTGAVIIASLRTLSEPNGDGLQLPIYSFFLLDSDGKVLSRLPCNQTDLIETCAINFAGGVTDRVR